MTCHPEKIVAWDLFCGCGGMSEGFEQCGFHVIFAMDSWQEAIDNYNHNHVTKAILADARDVARDPESYIKGTPGVIFGGPPCQGYSLAGNRDVMDPRNSLVDEFYTIVDKVRPPYFVMENVPGMMTMKRPWTGELIVDWISKRVGMMGYRLKWKKIYAHWYGVGQARPRLFFVGWLRDMLPPVFPPNRTHSNEASFDLFGNRIHRHVTVGDVLKSIPATAPNQELVYEFTNEEYIAKVKNLPQGKSLYDNFKESHKRLDLNKPAFTIKENHGSIAIHPTETRMINLREMSAMQGFSSDYEFIGDNRSIAKMIGNAVPPPLAFAVAIEVRSAMEKTNRERDDRMDVT